MQIEAAKAPLSLLFSSLETIELIPYTELRSGLNLAAKNEIREKLAKRICHCVECPIHSNRKKAVPGSGNIQSPLLLVLGMPENDEDETGSPAQGKSGELLEKMLLAIGWSKSSVYITHVVKCRSNATPKAEEIDACEKYLIEQIELLSPKMILAMGDLAAQTLFRTEADISHLRGKWNSYRSVPTISTWHPSQLLVAPERKKDAWEDLKKVKIFFSSK